MLKKMPEVGQLVQALENDGEEWGEPYLSRGFTYEIIGRADNGNSFHLDDNDSVSYIDEEAFYLFELVDEVKEAKSTKINITGIEIDAGDFTEYPTDFSFNFRMMGYGGGEILKTIIALQEDINKLLNK